MNNTDVYCVENSRNTPPLNAVNYVILRMILEPLRAPEYSLYLPLSSPRHVRLRSASTAAACVRQPHRGAGGQGDRGVLAHSLPRCSTHLTHPPSSFASIVLVMMVKVLTVP